jgi:hypothetical protein
VNREAELDRPSRVACSDLLAAFVMIMLSSPVDEYLGCPQAGSHHPCRNFGIVSNNKRTSPFNLLYQAGVSLGGAQVQEDVP